MSSGKPTERAGTRAGSGAAPLQPKARLTPRRSAEGVLSGPDLVRFAWLMLWAFLRIATNARVFERALSTAEAEAASSSSLDQPVAGILEPGERHWEILRGLVRESQTAGPLVMDAVLAAIALEHGGTVCTTDRDFARFAGLRWTNPLLADR